MTWTGDPIPAPGRAEPSTAATLRPDPERAILDLCARHQLVRPIARADQNAWRVAVRHVIAASNEVTAALRNDLPTDDRHDAAALWDSWRRAATRVRDRSKGLAPADAYPEPWEFRSQLELIGLAMASALARPGVFAARYCPWADDFYTAARLYPEESATATRNAAADREVEYEIQPGTSDRSTRGVHVAAPEISSVRFERSANPELPIGASASLWDAEQALRAAFERRRPVDGAAPVSTVFRVEWADGARHRATLPTDAATVRDDAAFGLLKAYLMRQGRAFADSADPALRAWGAELRHRLANDRSHPDALADVAAWRASLAFLPTGTGAPPVVADVVVALGADALVPSPDDGGLVFDSIAAADAAIGQYARTAGPRAPAGAIVAVRVTWVDGMRFTVWDPVPTVVRDLDGAAYIRAQIERRARHILAEGYAEKNARTLPRRDLAPQRAWAAELLRRLAADGPRNAAALPRVTEVRIRASENHAARRLVGQRFTSLRLADHALAHAFAVEPPPDDGADKTDFEVTWSDGASHIGTMDVTRAVLAAAASGLLDRHLRRYRAMVRSASYEGTARALGLDLADRRPGPRS